MVAELTGLLDLTGWPAGIRVIARNSISEEFIKLHSNMGGTCFGDSGGPNLLGGTNIVLAVTSFGANAICSGNTYSYRVDTAQALAWITATVRAHGASLWLQAAAPCRLTSAGSDTTYELRDPFKPQVTSPTSPAT
jgi:secreted trypsin-like serine protease